MEKFIIVLFVFVLMSTLFAGPQVNQPKSEEALMVTLPQVKANASLVQDNSTESCDPVIIIPELYPISITCTPNFQLYADVVNATYIHWSIKGGTIVSGQGTLALVINPSCNATGLLITLIASNECSTEREFIYIPIVTSL